MTQTDPDRTSLWDATRTNVSDPITYPHLRGDHVTDVVVVGGGITGLTTALRLIEAGLRVIVLEARHLTAGATGGTTGKVTSQHSAIYADLTDRHGVEVAAAYGRLNQWAIGEVRRICADHDVEGELTDCDALLYATSEDEAEQARAELRAALELGLPATWVERTEVPAATHGAVRFTGQLQINAVTYCLGLARVIAASSGCSVHTDSRVLDVDEEGDEVVVRTDHGSVRARAVVLATQSPITDRGGEVMRQRPVASYGIAVVATDGTDLPGHVYTSFGAPLRSVRHYHGEDRAYLVVVGESHNVGERDSDDPHAVLEAFAREHWDLGEVAYRWSAQDQRPDDRLPFVGRTAFSDHIYVATGMQKWGLSNGTWAAQILCDLITGVENPDADTFSPRRNSLAGGTADFARHIADVAKRFVADRVHPDVSDVEDIPAGGGATVRIGGRLRAVSRDDAGNLTECSAICTHLGCAVQWNGVERSWDCPCHGSRFASDGAVLNGPATRPLHGD